jgi:hypothetical protein
MRGSKHYLGDAADFRTWPVRTKTELLEIVETARHRLGNSFTVLLEKDHIHAQWNK